MSDDGTTRRLRLPKGSSKLMEALETRLPRRTRHLRYPVVVLSGQVGDGLARGFVAAYEDRCARRKIRHYAAGDENDYGYG